MAKGEVTEKELATGLKNFGGFDALGQANARPRREDPFRDTRSEASQSPPKIEVVKTRPSEPRAPSSAGEGGGPLRVREKKPAISRLARGEPRPERVPQTEPSAVEKKSELHMERLTLPLETEHRDAVEALAKLLRRRQTDKGERLAVNALIRVALRVLLEGFDLESAGVVNTEEELYEAVRGQLLPAKK